MGHVTTIKSRWLHGEIAKKIKQSSCDYGSLASQILIAASAVSSTAPYPFPFIESKVIQNPLVVSQNTRWHSMLLDPIAEYFQISNFHVYISEMLKNNHDVFLSERLKVLMQSFEQAQGGRRCQRPIQSCKQISKP